MAKVRLSVSALNDLEAIYFYISADSEVYAQNMVNKIYGRFKTLETHIRIGKVVAEFNDQSVRELIEGRYRIIYKIKNESNISILRVYHNSRLLKNL